MTASNSVSETSASWTIASTTLERTSRKVTVVVRSEKTSETSGNIGIVLGEHFRDRALVGGSGYHTTSRQQASRRSSSVVEADVEDLGEVHLRAKNLTFAEVTDRRSCAVSMLARRERFAATVEGASGFQRPKPREANAFWICACAEIPISLRTRVIFPCWTASGSAVAASAMMTFAFWNMVAIRS